MTALRAAGGSVAEDVRTVLFDKDGTLVDIHHHWAYIIELRATRLTEAISRREDRAAAAAALASAMGLGENRRLRAEGPIGVKPRAFIREVVRTELLRWGADVSVDRVEACFKEVDAVTLADIAPMVKLLPGVPRLLAALKDRGVRLAVTTTDITARAEAVLAAAGIATDFDVVVGGDRVTRHKPAPDSGKMALELLGLEASGCVVVGDHAVDIEMGRALGVSAIAVLTGIGTPESFVPLGCPVVRDLQELEVAT